MIDTWPIQQALYQALAVPAGPYPVFDAVPERQPHPYLVIGEIHAEPDDELAAPSLDLTVTIHGWSSHAGKAEAHQMLSFVRDRLLYTQLGAGIWACTEEMATVIEDRESTAARRIYHAAARYRIRAN